MRRKWIGIEMGEHALTHCLPRLQNGGGGRAGRHFASGGWQGGAAARWRAWARPFLTSRANQPQVRFAALAAHVWFIETGTPLPKPKRSACLGVHKGTAYYLLFNGILGDKSVDGGNVLTRRTLANCPRTTVQGDLRRGARLGRSG
jgi:adenine-specific DNA-methyltransferase